MANDLKMLITAELDEKATLKNLTASIRALEKHPTMQAIQLKINIDNSLVQILKSVKASVADINYSISLTVGMNNELNHSLANTAEQIRRVTSELNLQTQAVVKQNLAIQRNLNLSNTANGFASNASNSPSTNTGLTAGEKFSEVVSNVVNDTSSYAGFANTFLPTISAASAGGIGLAVTGLTMFVSYVIDEEQKRIQKEKEFVEKQYNIAKNWNNNESQVKSLVAESERPDTGAERQLAIANELNVLMPELVDHIDAQGQAHLKNLKYIKEELDYAQKIENIQFNQRDDKVKNTFEGYLDEYEKNKEGLEDTRALKIRGGNILRTSQYDVAFVKYNESELTRLDNVEADFEHKMKNNKRLIHELIEETSMEALKMNDIDLSSNLAKELENISHAIDISGLDKDQLSEKSEQVATFFRVLNSVGDKEGLDFTNTVNQLYSLGDGVGAGKKEVDNLVKLVYALALEQRYAVSSTIDLQASQDNMRQSVQEAESYLKPLNQAYRDISEGKSLSAEAMTDLVLLYPELSSQIKKTTDGWTIEDGVLKGLQKTERQRAIDKLEDEKKTAEATLKATSDRINAYKLELQAINGLNGTTITEKPVKPKDVKFNPYKSIVPGLDHYEFPKDKLSFDPLKLDYNRFFQKAQPTEKEIRLSVITDELPKLEEQKKTYEASLEIIDDSINGLKRLLDDPDYGVTGSNNKTPSRNSDTKEVTQAIINGINEEANARERLNSKISDRAQELEDEERYGEAIGKTTMLRASQLEETDLLISANKELRNLQNDHQIDSKWSMTGWLDSQGEQSVEFIKLYNKSAPETKEALQQQFNLWKLLNDAIANNEAKLSSLNKTHKETKVYEEGLRLNNTQFYLDKQGKALSEIDYKMQIAQKTQTKYTEGTEEYNQQQEILNSLHEDKINFLQKEVSWTENRLAQGDLQKDQILLLNQYLKDNKLALLDAQQAAHNYSKEFDTKYYEKFREKELDAIDKAMKAEEDRHDSRMEHLDDEMDKFQDAMDLVRKANSRSDDTTDFEKDLSNLQNEELDIRKNITSISADDSLEASYKREQLEKELADKLIEIEQLKSDRSRELRDQALDDMEKAKQTEIGAEKEKENALYKTNKEGLENIKLEIENFWKTTLENENTFLQDRSVIIGEHLTQVKGLFRNFVTESSAELTKLLGNDLLEKITGIKTPSNPSTPNGNSTGNGNTNGISYPSVFAKVGNGSYSPISESESRKINEMYQNSLKYKTANIVDKAKIANDNQLIGNSIEGVTFNANDGLWSKNGLRLYHEGGEAGVRGTTTKKWFDKVLKSNEVPAILKRGEVVLDSPIQFINHMASRIMNGISNTFPGTLNGGSSNSSGALHFDKLIHIDRVENTATVDYLVDQLDRKFKKIGFNM